MPSLGIDVGGANLKVATDDGHFEIIYLPIWKRLNELESKLMAVREEFEPDNVGVVMTAELSDVFATKVEGVKRIAEIVNGVFGNAKFLDLDGSLKSYDEVIENPRDFMASNWIASAKFLLEEGWRNVLFTDMGSTTTDLIPITDRIEAGKTDYERLKRGELLYFGALRTPVFYILPKFDVPLASEFFSIAGDAFVVTGDIEPEDYTCDTPDGRGRDVESCMRRLARCVCADIEEVGDLYIMNLAETFKSRMLEILSNAIKTLTSKFGLRRVLGCGIGEFLLKEATEESGLEYVSLAEEYGEVSKALPAYAMSNLICRYYLSREKY